MDTTVRMDTASSMTLRISYLLYGCVLPTSYIKHMGAEWRILQKEEFRRPIVWFCGCAQHNHKM